MTDWLKVINGMAPSALPAIAQGLANSMPQVIREANLNSNLRIAHFLAQVAHESAGFKTTIEYASGKAYNGRKDLGNVQPNDGVRFKGRGLIQITGRSNYAAMGKALGQDFISDPTEMAHFPWAALTAAVYWKTHNINRYADRNDIKAVTKIINGGYNGLSDREHYFNLAQKALMTNKVSVDQNGIDVPSAQKRLASLSYPVGGIDGDIGPLTRSAIRDFQDASNLPITGQLDQNTYDLLMSSKAQKRPVSTQRETLTAADLKAKGSGIITATESIKGNVTTASAALAGAAGVAGQINDAAGQIDTIKDAVKTGNENLGLLAQNWQLAVIGILLIVVAFCIYKCWKMANTIESERVRQAKTGENVRI